jgi:hypothetical protein
MARQTKALITRQDLIDMANEGLVLLRPGSGIEVSGTNINKVLSREEIVQFSYLYGGNYDLGDGTFTSESVFTGPETTAPTPGFAYDVVTIQKFVPDPAVDGRVPNSGSITNVYASVPDDKNRMTHYGIDARFSDYILSPAVSVYSKTIHLINQGVSGGPVTGTITVGKSGTTPTATYSRSSVGSTDLSGNIRLGNLVNFSLSTTAPGWSGAGTLILEIWENNVLTYSKNLAIGNNGSGTLSVNNWQINRGINYEFKGKSSIVTEFPGAFSNVTGQRACNLL